MNISPIHCPNTDCYWAAFGIPDKYTEARDWHLAAHRAEEHGKPLTAEQLAYATKAGHTLPAAAVAAQGALPVPVGDQPQPLDATRLDEIATRAAHLYEYVPMPVEADHLAGEDVPALLAEVERLKAALAAAREATLDEAADWFDQRAAAEPDQNYRARVMRGAANDIRRLATPKAVAAS
jgi:hypothetical protein